MTTSATGSRQVVPGRRALRLGRMSTVWRPRTVGVAVILLVLVVSLVSVDIAIGEIPLPVLDVLRTLLGGGDRGERFIVLDVRLPRTLTALLVGTALGISGAITQAVARNPLASPDVLGITYGAGAAAVAVVVLAPAGGVVAAAAVPTAALLGGVLTATLVYLLAWRRGVDGFRLVLVGIAVGSVMLSITSYLLVVANSNDASRATVWLTGSLDGRGFEHVAPLGGALVVFGALTAVAAFALGPLGLGTDTAVILGVSVQRSQLLVLVAAVGLASVATASAGPIAFVAFLAPQVARRLIRTAGAPLLTGALVGAVLMLGSDVVARTVLPTELPVGIVTAAIGAPFFVVLLIRRSRRFTV